MKSPYSARKSAYSLVEMLVSLAIIAILIVMLSNILTNVIQASRKSAGRSFVREELALVIDKLITDVRSANRVETCSGTQETAICTISTAEGTFRWRLCDQGQGLTAICRQNAQDVVVYSTSSALKIESFTIEESLDLSGDSDKSTVLFTLTGSHSNTNLQITNLIAQAAVATRNLDFISTSQVNLATPQSPQTTNPGCATNKVLTFESPILAEGTVITNQYLTAHGVRFSSSGTTTHSGGSYSCISGAPVTAQLGGSRYAFTNDTYPSITQDFLFSPDNGKVGSTFLSGVGRFGVTPFCPISMILSTPTTEFAFDLIDVDEGERYLIRFFDSNSAEISTLRQTVSAPVGDHSKDGRITRVSAKVTGSTLVSSVTITAATTKSSPWGMAIDNIWPQCANPPL